MGGVRERFWVRLVRLVLSKLLLVLVGRFFWIGLFGAVRKFGWVVVCSSNLFIIVSGDMLVGKGEGVLRIGYFILSVVVVCMNIGDEEFICCWMGRWYRFFCEGILVRLERLLLAEMGICFCCRFCGLGVIILVDFVLVLCGIGSFGFWKNEF